MFAGTLICNELINTIVPLSTSLITGVKYLKTVSYNDNELQELLLSSDVINDILIIKSFLEEKKFDRKSPTITSCISNLNEIMIDIEKVVNSMTKKIQVYNKSWFKYVWYYDIRQEKKELPVLIIKLKHRFNLLIKISNTI